MSGSVSEQQGNHRLHFPHLKGLVDLEKNVAHAFKGLYRWRRPEHAVTTGNLRHVVHPLTPSPPAPANFFTTANQQTDIVLPTHLHYVDQIDVHLVLTNTSGVSAETFESKPSNLYSRIEVRKGSAIIQTVEDLDQFVDTVIYRDPWETDRHVDSTMIDKFGVNTMTSIAPGADSNTIRIRIPTVLTRCGIPLAAAKDKYSIRFYSQAASNVMQYGNVSLKEFKVMVREVRGDERQLQSLAQPHLDWRFLEPKYSEKSGESLTSGSTTTIELTNFSPDDLCSHMWVFVRNSSLAGANRDDMLSNVVDAIWLTNESGHNLTNGIQWKGDDLLKIVYPDKFQNTASVNHGVYLIYCPAIDPVSDYRDGTMSGAQALSSKMKLHITSKTTGTYNITAVAMVHKHARLDRGDLNIQ